MTNIKVNDKSFEGKHIEVTNGEVQVDGKKVDIDTTSGLEIRMDSNGEDLTANVNIKNEGITIVQSTKTGNNNMKISF